MGGVLPPPRVPMAALRELCNLAPAAELTPSAPKRSRGVYPDDAQLGWKPNLKTADCRGLQTADHAEAASLTCARTPSSAARLLSPKTPGSTRLARRIRPDPAHSLAFTLNSRVPLRTWAGTEDGSKASSTWWAPGQSMPNETETLLMALLVLGSGAGDVDIDAWAEQVLGEEAAAAEQGSRWAPPASWPARNASDSPFMALRSMSSQLAGRDALEPIAVAIGLWRGAGQWAGIDWQQIVGYRRRVIGDGPRKANGKGFLARFSTSAIVDVAKLVRRRRSELLSALAQARLV